MCSSTTDDSFLQSLIKEIIFESGFNFVQNDFLFHNPYLKRELISNLMTIFEKEKLHQNIDFQNFGFLG